MPFDPPPPLATALANETGAHARARLQAAAESLSERYRSGRSIPVTLSPQERAAYLAAMATPELTPVTEQLLGSF